MNLLTRLTGALAAYGLNLIGTTSRAAYEALVPTTYGLEPLLPQTRSVIVIGNGGGAFWTGFRPYAARHAGDPHPLDDYTVEVVERSLTPILAASGARYRYAYPFRFRTEPVSFMHLAQAAGLAGPSRLGIMLHPVYGPWLALGRRSGRAKPAGHHASPGLRSVAGHAPPCYLTGTSTSRPRPRALIPALTALTSLASRPARQVRSAPGAAGIFRAASNTG